jgi:hypothetical protein
MIGIEPARLTADRTYRLTWTFDAWDETEMSMLQAGIEYWHVDRFRTELLIDCDGVVLDRFTVPPGA